MQMKVFLLLLHTAWLIIFKELILQRHGNRAAPNTHIEGSYPIDGIFASPLVRMVRGGYSEFHLDASDHRMIWVDVSSTRLFGHHIHSSIQPRARRLNSNNPGAVNKFMKSFKRHCSNLQIHRRAIQLDNAVHLSLSMVQRQQLEELDKDIVEGILEADRRCRHIYLGTVPFSAEYQLLKNKCTFWKRVLRRQQGKKTNFKSLTRLQRSCQIGGQPLYLSEFQVKKELRQALKEYKLFKPQGPAKRRTWLEELAHDRAAQMILKLKVKSRRLLILRLYGNPLEELEG